MKTKLLLFSIALAAALSPALAQAQNLFVSCDDGNVYEFTTNGVQSTFASGLGFPEGLAVDGAGNLFVANNGGNIYKFTPDGARSPFASGLVMPRGLAFDSAGNLYEGDAIDASHGPGFGCIYKFTPGGTRTTFFAYSSSCYFNAYGLAFDSAGNLFVSNPWSFGISIFNFAPDGTESTFVGGYLGAYGIAFDSAGNLFAACRNDGNVYEFTTNGVQSTFASGLNYPQGLAFDSAGNLFVTEYFSGNIYKFTPAGTRSTFASGLSGPEFLAFQGAFVTPPPAPPPVSIAPAGSQVVLYWPASATNCVLEATTNLTTPNWAAVTNGTPIVGITLTNTSPALFFRLHQY